MTHTKKERHSVKKRPPLVFIVTVIAFFVMVATMLLAVAFVYLIGRLPFFHFAPTEKTGLIFILVEFAAASILLGTVISFVIFKVSLKPLSRMIQALNRLAGGDYRTRLYFGERKAGKALADSFNTLAEELENTEMLRSDFINNFSHEFKTPIVSIYGFARLLLKGNLPEEQTKEYLTIIEQESGRLSAMATNVLNLTKVENQNILTNVTRFNLSEQLRRCVLLLEKKWAAKNIQPSCGFSEHMVCANEELLCQVWINLLDNAIKFAPENGQINVRIYERPETIRVSIANNGPKIGERDQARIFNKFYQGDTSHASAGTGIGLSVVKKITELHQGRVWADSTEQETVFWVELPVRLP